MLEEIMLIFTVLWIGGYAIYYFFFKKDEVEYMEEKLKQIINHYGVVPQLKYLQSEVFELNESVIRYEELQKSAIAELDCNPQWDEEYKQHITEELADVMVMLCQFKEHYEIDGNKIMDIMNQKIDRQLERIENEEV